MLCKFARASIAKYCRLGSFNNRNVFPPSSAGLASSKGFAPQCEMGFFT